MQSRHSSTIRAQGMTEYIIILVLVAIALITVVTIFGTDIKEMFAESTGAIAEGRSDSYNPITQQAIDGDIGIDGFEDSRPPNPYEYDEQAGRWRDPNTGRFVSDTDVEKYRTE